MNNTVTRILGDISTLSASAKTLVDRLPMKYVSTAADEVPTPTELAFGDGIDISELQTLRAKVVMLESRVLELTQDLEAARDVEMTDVEAANFKTTFTRRAVDTPQPFLEAVYDRSYFIGTSRSLRPLIAQCLMEITQNRNKPVPTLWQRAANSDGAI